MKQPSRASVPPETSHLRAARPGRRHAAVAAGLLCLALVACSSKATPDDQAKKMKPCKQGPIEIFIQAHKTLNQNEKGQSMPVEVRVLLLREREKFDRLDFESVWTDDGKALGKDLVKSTSLTVFPGKLKIHPMKNPKDVNHIALVGIFRKPEGRKWQYVVDVRAKARRCSGQDDLHTIIHASLRGNRISKPNHNPAS